MNPRVQLPQLEEIVEGAALLGSGGGGTVAVGRALATVIECVTGGAGVVVLAPPYPLDDGALLVVAADVGAADTFVPNQDQATLHAVQVLAEALALQGPIAAIVPGEVGPESTLAAAAVAAHLGIPVVDGDGVGRAVPVLPLSLFDVGGVSASPCAIAGTGPESAVLRASDADGVEDLMRPLLALPAFGDSAGMALWAMGPAQLRQLAVRGTLGLAGEIGATLAAARAAGEDAATAVLELEGLSGAVLVRGTATRVSSADSGGFTQSAIRICVAGEADAVVTGENENLVLWREDRPSPVATAPDLLCWLTTDGFATTTSELVDGAGPDGVGAVLLGLHADPRLWASPTVERFATVLSGAGYHGPPVPVGSAR
jgi:DUF917 family protein